MQRLDRRFILKTAGLAAAGPLIYTARGAILLILAPAA